MPKIHIRVLDCGDQLCYNEGSFRPTRRERKRKEGTNMDLTCIAAWLDSALFGFDSAILGALHAVAEAMGGVLTPIARLITLVGEKGIIFFAAALVLACFARTRKTAVCLFGAVCCGALVTNIILKDAVARLRPCDVEAFAAWWQTVGAPPESGFSFPSGHVTATSAGLCALSLMRGRRWVSPAVGGIILMAFSRCYLMAHYPSDVLAAALIGLCSALIAWEITRVIYLCLERTAETRFSRFVLEFDVRQLRRH
jgi:undecaprenyl-diphosphatase